MEDKRKNKEQEKKEKATVKKLQLEAKARAKIAQVIHSKVAAVTLSMHGILTLRLLSEIEAGAKACVDDKSKPLPDICSTVSTAVDLCKKAKAEQGKMARLLMFLNKASGGA